MRRKKTSVYTANLVLSTRDTKQSLYQMGLFIRNANQSYPRMEILRLMISESNRHPDIIRHARDLLLRPLTERLIAYFEELIRHGAMDCDNPKAAALSFILLCVEGFRPLFNAQGSEAERQAQFDADMKMFIRGYHIKTC